MVIAYYHNVLLEIKAVLLIGINCVVHKKTLYRNSSCCIRILGTCPAALGTQEVTHSVCELFREQFFLNANCPLIG